MLGGGKTYGKIKRDKSKIEKKEIVVFSHLSFVNSFYHLEGFGISSPDLSSSGICYGSDIFGAEVV